MEKRNLHLPPDTRIHPKSPLSRWKDVPPTRPKIAPRTFKPEIVSDELLSIIRSSGDMATFRRMLQAHESPSGLLFRCEDIFAFLSKAALAEMDFPGSPVPLYFSGRDRNLGHCIRTTPSIVRAMTIYGTGWQKHFGSSYLNITGLEEKGVIISRAHLLLLAIDPGDAKIGSGMDQMELGIAGPVPVSRLFILNNDPELAMELIRMDPESRHVHLPLEKGLAGVFNFSPSMEFLRSGLRGPHGGCVRCLWHMKATMNGLLREAGRQPESCNPA